MNSSAGRRTWEEASSPAAVRLAREYERAWQDSTRQRHRPDPCDFHGSSGELADAPGTRLALLRADMALRREAGEPVGARWYLERYHDLGEDTIVALIYEEFCLREEEESQKPDPAEFLARFPEVEKPLRRVLEIHQLVSSERGNSVRGSSLGIPAHAAAPEDDFPSAGQSISGFQLVEELGRGSFARVFLARERELADRPVAVKVTRRGSREPQTLARLQHTHIVPIYSHRIDQNSGLHLLCMPYFGPVTLARLLADPAVKRAVDGAQLVEALDRLAPAESPPQGRSAGRSALQRRSYPLAVAWWAARLAEALDHAHDRGVLHRDLKPSNVLVTPDGMPMLLDFNLAHELVLDDGSSGGDTLGGTLDYMSPEHLRALAENTPGRVDSRSDIYSLGIVIHEAVAGRRPFGSATRGASIVEALLRAADERLLGAPRLRATNPEIPAPFETVIRRCLEPDPIARYQSAAQLATDLHAVANDLPLVHAQEPWYDRLLSSIRRNRRRFATAAVLLSTLTVLYAFFLGFVNSRADGDDDRVRFLNQNFEKGKAAAGAGDFATAYQFFETAADQAGRSSEEFKLSLSDWRRILAAATTGVFDKLSRIGLDRAFDIRKKAAEQALLAKRTAETRAAAEAVFKAADHLRFRFLLGTTSQELASATTDLKHFLEPFYVFKNPDWTKLDHILRLLDDTQKQQLVPRVNELLFLWLCTIDDSVASSLDDLSPEDRGEARTVLSHALEECDHALKFADPRPPWLALRARLAGRLESFGDTRSGQGSHGRSSVHLPGEPRDVSRESSALVCFQWSLLHSRGDGNLERAIEWMQRSLTIQPDDYWYAFYLASIEDHLGAKDAALKDYSIAVALKPNSPWVRLNLGRHYRSRGQYSAALHDIELARAQFEQEGRPEVHQAHLQLGLLHQELGNYREARRNYALLERAGPLVPAARLNLADIKAETGDTRGAAAEMTALIQEDPADFAARHSRALLDLRMGQPAAAEADLTTLLEHQTDQFDKDDLLAERALARLLRGKPAEALTDASHAFRLNPSPTHARLRDRATVAARRDDLLRLERPEDLNYFPLAGFRLRAELKAAAGRLMPRSDSDSPVAYRSSLNLAVILAFLGRHGDADQAASRAILMSPYSQTAYLIRGRVRLYGGDLKGARSDVAAGLALEPGQPDLLAIRGRIHLAADEPELALQDFEQAIALGARDPVHAFSAEALASLRKYRESLNQWTLALRRDPEWPEAFLGRARAEIELGYWDMALADLEHAVSWANADPRMEFSIVWAYLRCLPARLNNAGRWCELIARTARHFAAAHPSYKPSVRDGLPAGMPEVRPAHG